MSELIEEDRQFIKKAFSDDIDKGKISYSSESATSYLAGVAMSLKAKPELERTVINKAETLISEDTELEDKHFFYDQKIKVLKKSQGQELVTDELLRACEQQIALAVEFGKVIRREDGRDVISHTGYDTITKELSYLGRYKEAISYVKKQNVKVGAVIGIVK